MSVRAAFTGRGERVPPVKLAGAGAEQLIDTENDWIEVSSCPREVFL